jgi:protein TonB
VKPEPKAEPAAAEEDGDEPQTAETPAQDASQKPAAATSAPAAAGGAPGGAPGGVPGSPGSGAGQGEGVGSDPYNFYIALLNQRIKGAWKRPLYGGKEVLTATVSLEVSRSGRVLKLDLVSPSGMDALDKSVMRAVRDAEPFPPLPTNLALDTLPVKIAFDLKPDALGSAPGE